MSYQFIFLFRRYRFEEKLPESNAENWNKIVFQARKILKLSVAMLLSYAFNTIVILSD